MKEVEEKGREAPGVIKYEASKYRAEKVAWGFYEKNKENAKFDVVVINPGRVMGVRRHLLCISSHD